MGEMTASIDVYTVKITARSDLHMYFDGDSIYQAEKSTSNRRSQTRVTKLLALVSDLSHALRVKS